MRIGTRGSALALWQARHVAARLAEDGVEAALDTITTKGDRILDVPLAEIGDKGLFTHELDRALLDGSVDLAVHSLKDLPTALPEGLALAAVSEREDPRDAFVAHPDYAGPLKELPEGAIVATSSLRRQAQLLAWRPDLQVIPVRGNVPTRIAKLDDSGAPGRGGWHGILLATAGLVRLGLQDRIRERLSETIMLPAVGQGALGIVTRADHPERERLLRLLGDPATTAAVTAERALLRTLEGGCQVPVAAWGRVEGDLLSLEGAVASLDGRDHVRASASGTPEDAESLGVALARTLSAQGAAAILAAIRDGDAA